MLIIKINQYSLQYFKIKLINILNNTDNYNKVDYPETCDIMEIYTEKENRIYSVFAINHMKYKGLEKYYDVRKEFLPIKEVDLFRIRIFKKRN